MKKFEEMNIKEKLNSGYTMVIVLMIISEIFSMIGLGSLYGSVNSFVNGANRADTAVKICRIDVNIAARSIREMALNDDTSSYAGYKQKVEERLTEVGTELQALKATGLIDDSLYQKYSESLNVWGVIGYEIIEKIEAGEHDEAIEMILTECTPALDEVITISQEIDAVTNELMNKSIATSRITFIIGVVIIVLFIAVATLVSRRLGNRIVSSITEPLAAIEEVAMELTEGNLHSQLEYRSQDEIGRLAHSLRKSIRILGSYVDDISRVMEEFANGNFCVQPEVEWRGDFIGISDAIATFERSISETIKGIQSVADQVSVLASQSAGAAKESTVLIEASVRAVEKGMVIADETAVRLEQAVAGSKIITEDVNKVAGALESQMASFTQINAGVEHINDVVQTNSATSQQCAAASQEMNSQASTLDDLVSKFKVE